MPANKATFCPHKTFLACHMKTHYEDRRHTLRKILQHEGRSMSTQELHQSVLQWKGTSCDIRTTRRDLEALKEAKFVAEEKGTNCKNRYWKLGKNSFELVLSPTESMTLAAIFQHAERFGFRAQTEQLARLREYATAEIRTHSKRPLVAEGRITTGTRFTVLKPGRYDPAHLEVIQQALLDDQPLEVVYRPKDVGDVPCTYFLKPLALSYQDSNIYLSAYVKSETWPDGFEPPAERGKYSSNGPNKTCALMLHRMEKVRSCLGIIPDPEHYDVHAFEVQRDLNTIHSELPIPLKLRLSANLHNRLSENPLTDDQVLTWREHGWVLECQTLDTQGLRLFLLSNAADIEVLAPPTLRTHMRQILAAALHQYDLD